MDMNKNKALPPVPIPPIVPDREPSSLEVAAQPIESKNYAPPSQVYIDSTRDALVGIPDDLMAGRGSLYEVFTKNHRLRGLGVLLVVIALFVAVSGLLR